MGQFFCFYLKNICQLILNWIGKKTFTISSIGYTLIGVLFAVVAFKGFMIPNHFMDGGVNGISILISEVFHINIALPLFIVNIPFIMLGYKKIGKSFAIHSFLALVLLCLGLQFIEVPVVTKDKVLIAVFVGLSIGAGIGFVIKGGGAIDGLEVIAVDANKNSKFSTNEIILFVNTLIFISVAYFTGMENAMYSLLTFFTALQISKYIVDGFEEYTSLNIVSGNHNAIKEVIVKDFGKAISAYKGERGYLPASYEVREDVDIIVTVVTRLEIFAIQEALHKVDPKAFVFIQSIKEVKGGLVKQIRKH